MQTLRHSWIKKIFLVSVLVFGSTQSIAARQTLPQTVEFFTAFLSIITGIITNCHPSQGSKKSIKIDIVHHLICASADLLALSQCNMDDSLFIAESLMCNVGRILVDLGTLNKSQRGFGIGEK